MSDTINTIKFLYKTLTCIRNISNDVFRFSPLIVTNHYIKTIPQQIKELTELIKNIESYIIKAIDILQVGQPITVDYQYHPDVRFSSNTVKNANKMFGHHISNVTMLSFNIYNYQSVLNGYGLFATIMCNNKAVDISENQHNNITMLHMAFQLVFTYLSYMIIEGEQMTVDNVTVVTNVSTSIQQNPTSMGIITTAFAEDKNECPICLETYNNLHFVWSTNCPHSLCKACTTNLYKNSSSLQCTITCPVCRREKLPESLYSLAKITKYELQNYNLQ